MGTDLWQRAAACCPQTSPVCAPCMCPSRTCLVYCEREREEIEREISRERWRDREQTQTERHTDDRERDRHQTEREMACVLAAGMGDQIREIQTQNALRGSSIDVLLKR